VSCVLTHSVGEISQKPPLDLTKLCPWVAGVRVKY